MVGKAAGFAFCAHCGARAAEVECPGCEQMTCAPCAADFRTCRVPHVVTRDLPRRQRVRRIDRKAERALMGRAPSLLQRIFHIAPRQRLVDLATLEPVPLPVAPPHDAIAALAGGEAVWRAADGTICRARGGWQSARTYEVEHPYDQITADEQTLWTIADNVLWYFDLPTGEERAGGGLPRKLLVTAAAVDRPGAPILLGTIGSVGLWIPSGDRFRRAGSADLPGNAEPCACILRGNSAAVIGERFTERGLRRSLHVFHLSGESLDPIELPSPIVGIEPRPPIDLTADGRWLAVASNTGELLVYDLVARTLATYDGHHARITTLRIAADGSRLVTADTGGRLVLRPRLADGFAR